jgi:peroxiredoxin Q/BCP
LGASFDTREENRAFSEKYDFNFPLLCDTDRSIGLAYGACSEATAGFAKRIGIVIDADGKVRDYDAQVNPKSYPQDVLNRL